MKISSTECGRASASAAESAVQEKILPKDMPRKKSASQSTSGQLTPLEQGIAIAQEALKGISDTRDDVVEDIRKRIAEGEYRVSGEEVADMMMRRRAADRIR